MYEPSAYFPKRPFEASPAFTEWLATLLCRRVELKPKGDDMQIALQLAEEGAKRAAKHADRVHGDFTDKALAAFRAYAIAHKDFTTEAVRLAYAAVVPQAPDNRAWGAVARSAIRAGICKRVGMTRAKSGHCHGTWISTYESLLYGAGGK